MSRDDLGEVRMIRHFDDELNELRSKILSMGALVEAQLQDALRALTERDPGLAKR